ncbi:hypothetical protein Sjap_016962 [Stephania japonica]|uniref:AAA+ ATPase domain-containing protein n=1 Tax=Stephania japonica TaxID=461633 RepID=A0AAP0I592_9MAGN
MFSIPTIPSATAAFSAYTALAAWTMLLRNILDEIQSVVNKLVPEKLKTKLLTLLTNFISVHSSLELTLVINNNQGQGSVFNRLFEAAEFYLPTKISSSVHRLGVSQGPKDANLSLSIEKDQEIVDYLDDIELRWKSVFAESEKTNNNKKDRKSFELSFQKKHMKRVLEDYLPYVLKRTEAIKEERKVVKLYSLHFHGDNSGGERWGWINLDHPATFDTLAMDLEMKRELKEDLDRFVRRREYYRRVGKAWKRGYLLYGPPGTGKSSLVAAMANYLNFNIYDLELSSVHSNSNLRNLLVGTSNRSIIVIEDIDCSVELQNRDTAPNGRRNGDNQLTLSGLLNVIDGLWSSLGDERIIVFTTNHKDRLDPALLRPGRMDMHIHMSYCNPDGFKLLASNYLGIKDHQSFNEIEGLMKEVNVTPAEVAEELMKSDDPNAALNGLLKFLKRKATECDKLRVEVKGGVGDVDGGDGDEGQGTQITDDIHVAERTPSNRNIIRNRIVRSSFTGYGEAPPMPAMHHSFSR